MPPATKPLNSDVFGVCLGDAAVPVGRLKFVSQGRRELAQFVYEDSWLSHERCFEISPDLPRQSGYFSRRAAGDRDSPFFFALADTEPDAWGRQVIDRAHAKARRKDATLAPLRAIDYLCAVDDFSRIGALRLTSGDQCLRAVPQGERATPPFIELERVYRATRAVESSKETQEDLRYLQGKGTSLGGMRPKCTVLDETGHLAIGKFPSIADSMNVTRAEVLALRLARRAGIDVPEARAVEVKGIPIALIRRFDRTTTGARIPYLSAASMLQAEREERRAYTELVDLLMRKGANPSADARELWRRLAFNLLITNTDDHLRNLGFLYDGGGQWRLAPAFDLNAMPGKLRESKTWLSEDSGPIDSIGMLMDACGYFKLSGSDARTVLEEVVDAIDAWRHEGMAPEVGLTKRELDAFKDAFEHDQTREARELLRA
ncbi:type II toxin-antitoxin system HipA family toxin [Roseateles sp.]|uniref:type II toxin-antitoxin system HipA family toxin n=1 Tax=Roseateles sp. TaxID=1971397 RepID=UPI0031D064FB